MGSDKARLSYDETRQYRQVVSQQGRVTLEADWNEAQQIASEELRRETLDIVGPCGTPDDGYRIVETGKPGKQAFDIEYTGGTMYVGGLRVSLAKDHPHYYSNQTEWADHLDDPTWIPPGKPANSDYKREYIYLFLREQEVSAVEDTDLREVALGGPDTAGRVRLVQRVKRRPTNAQECNIALEEAARQWEENGWFFEAGTMRLLSASRLLLKFKDLKKNPDPCEPQAVGGYLGADNQLIRVQISAYDAANQVYRLVWGFDNASFLYRVKTVDDKTVQFLARPVDDFHQPRAGQTVEVLRTAVELGDENYLAAPTGTLFTLGTAYDPFTRQLSLPNALDASYLDPKETPQVFVRVWEQELKFELGQPVDLAQTGLQVIISSQNNQPLAVGDFWQIAVRPSTPTAIYPRRYLETPQPADGPRLWVCPLGIVEWEKRILKVVADCRNPFDNLVELTARKSSGCCTVQVSPQDLAGDKTLQSIIDGLQNQAQATICLAPGEYKLPQPLRLGANHSHLTIEGCHDGVVLRAAEGREDQFLDGLVVMNHANYLTFRNLRFDLPQVPFLKAGGKLVGLGSAALQKIVGSLLEDLEVSIGLRTLHCALLTVENCLFRFSLTPNRDVFGAGIFAGSECWGLKLIANRFVREEDYLRVRERPFRMLTGLLLTPTIFTTGKRGSSQRTRLAPGTFVPALLEDALIRDNLFAGLTVAFFISADTGLIRLESNTVRDCYAGFWLIAPRDLAFYELSEQVQVHPQLVEAAGTLQAGIYRALLDPLVQIGSALARSYPLPPEVDLKELTGLGVEAARSGSAEEKEPVQNMFNRVLRQFTEKQTNISQTQGQAPTPAGASGSSEENSGGAEEKTELKLDPEQFKENIFQLKTGLGQYRNLHGQLAAFTRAALVQAQQKNRLHLSLNLTGNRVDAMLTESQSPSSSALLVWDDDLDISGGMVIQGDNFQNNSTTMPTVMVRVNQPSVLTGNLIFNEAASTDSQGAYSLFLYPGSGEIAVTANVLRGLSTLPRIFRPNVPAPFNTWVFFNTQI